MIYAQQGRSIPQRVFLVVCQFAFLVLAGWMLLGGGIAVIGGWFGWHASVGDATRRALLFACSAILFVRIAFTSLYLLKRAIGWEEALTIPLAFAMYYVGFGLLGGTVQRPVDGIDWLAIVLFGVGSAINTGSELLRDVWKKQPQNKGKLYTGGLFRYSRHANYFGDLVWVSAWALLTRNPWSALIPLLLFAFFRFYNAPMLEQHLAEKYGEAFTEYCKTTKMLIPFVL